MTYYHHRTTYEPRSADVVLSEMSDQEKERERMAKEWQSPHRSGVKIIIGAALLVLTLGGLYLLGAL